MKFLELLWYGVRVGSWIAAVTVGFAVLALRILAVPAIVAALIWAGFMFGRSQGWW